MHLGIASRPYKLFARWSNARLLSVDVTARHGSLSLPVPLVWQLRSAVLYPYLTPCSSSRRSLVLRLRVAESFSGWRELAQFVSDHVLCHREFVVDLPIVNLKLQTDKVRQNRCGAGMCLDGRCRCLTRSWSDNREPEICYNQYNPLRVSNALKGRTGKCLDLSKPH